MWDDLDRPWFDEAHAADRDDMLCERYGPADRLALEAVRRPGPIVAVPPRAPERAGYDDSELTVRRRQQVLLLALDNGEDDDALPPCGAPSYIRTVSHPLHEAM